MTVAASFWGSGVALLGVLLLSFLAAFVVSTFLLGTRARAKRERKLAERIGQRAAKAPEGVASETTPSWMPEAMVQVGRRFAIATGFSARLDDRLEQAGLPILAGEFVVMTVLSALVGAVVAAIFLLNVVFVLLTAAIAAFAPYVWLKRAARKRRAALIEQLADSMSILSTSMRAGYSFLQALDTMAKEIGEPSASEFARAVAEIRLGRPIEDALTAMAERIDSDDLRWAVIAINIQRQVGGNLAEVLDILAGTVRERAYIRRQVSVLSAEGRLSVGVLSAIPFGLFAYISVVNPGYLQPLFTTTPGLIMLIGGGLFVGTGIFVMTRMIKIDV
ncbi:MAG: type II secretion system F family protein [Actinomycetota bacterium]